MNDVDEAYRRYRDQAETSAKAMRKRYRDEADYYAELYGLPRRTENDDAWDAFRHAYASAAMRKEYGPLIAHGFGDANEVWSDKQRSQYSFSKHMDRWNNAVGRRLAEGAADNDEIADRIHDSLKRGELITDPFTDARYYTGPTILPSPSDYDRNRIYEGELPPPLGAPVAKGPPSPALGINLHRYYGPILGGGMVVPDPQDNPLSPDEIARMRRGVPSGGLF